MKKVYLIFLFATLCSALASTANAATRYAVATGNWNSTSTWSATSGGPAGASVPVAGDAVVFGNTNVPVTVTVTADASCDSIHIDGPTVTGDNILLMNSGVTLTVLGNVEIDGSHQVAQKTSKLVVNGGTLTVNGDLIVGCHTFQQAFFDLSNGVNAASVVNVKGNFTNTATDRGNFIPGGNSTINFNGTSPQTINFNKVIGTYANININNSSGVTLGAAITATNVTGNLTVQSGTLNNGGFAITLAANKSFSVSNGATFQMTGTTGMVAVSGTGSKSFGSTSTVEYAGASQTVSAESYGHLTLSGSSTKTFAAGTTGIAGTFTISRTATADATTNSTTINYNGSGAQTVGAINYTNLTLSNAGTKTFAAGTSGITGTFTISGTATADATTNSTTINYNGTGAQTVVAINYNNLTSSSTGARTLASSGTIGVAGTFTPGTNSYTTTGSTIDFNSGTGQSIPSFTYNNLTVSGARTTNSVTLASSGTIGIAGAFSTTATFTSGGYVNTSSTIDFNGTGAQTISAFDYYNLTISAARTTNSVTLASSGTIGIAAVFTTTATFTSGSYIVTGSTINYNGSSAQTVTVFGYNHLTFSNTGLKTISASITAAGNVTISSGASISVAGSVTLQVNGSMTTAGSLTNAGTVTTGP